MHPRFDRKMAQRPDRRRSVVRHIEPCRTDGCDAESKTHAGPYAGLCDDCIIALGHHLVLT